MDEVQGSSVLSPSPKFYTGMIFCHKWVAGFILIIWILSFFWPTTSSGAGGIESLKSMIGPRDSLLVADPDGTILISKNAGKKLMPASILKIFTSLGALHYLGPDFHFQTEFYMDEDSNLKIKGFGDPLLISEIVDGISRLLAALIGNSVTIKDLIVDDSYFNRPLTIPGVSSSSQPYDAPNGALCVNFNTVVFKRTKSGYSSAEPQTPLLPFAEKKIKTLNLKSGRVVMSHAENENTIYAGKLFRHFLEKHGARVHGKVRLGRVNQDEDQLIFRHVSPFPVEELVARLLEHSNNFAANQLFIASGIKAFGPPGNLEKGVAAALDYARNSLQIADMTIVEGSGISRKNRVSAHHMHQIIEAFVPHRRLLRREGRDYYKTGTLNGVSTRAGYIAGKNDRLYRYVVMMNTPGKAARPVIRRMLRALR
jgi:D-alanyl-D-alanine carboxypeptidase/D-alanyl-D-alanine-endopeptidase (penicillin-binding protein 4)